MIKKAKSKLDLKIGESNTGRDSRDTRIVYLEGKFYSHSLNYFLDSCGGVKNSSNSSR